MVVRPERQANTGRRQSGTKTPCVPRADLSTLKHDLGHDARWCKVVYDDGMASTEKVVRQSVSIPRRIANRVRSLAKTQKKSANRVLIDLIEAGLESKDSQRERFFAIANRLTETTEPGERQRLKQELARMTFGE